MPRRTRLPAKPTSEDMLRDARDAAAARQLFNELADGAFVLAGNIGPEAAAAAMTAIGRLIREDHGLSKKGRRPEGERLIDLALRIHELLKREPPRRGWKKALAETIQKEHRTIRELGAIERDINRADRLRRFAMRTGPNLLLRHARPSGDPDIK